MKSISLAIVLLVVSHRSVGRRFYQTKEELELTKEEPLITQLCPTDKPIAIFVLSAGRSVGKYFDKRQAVRQTWAEVAKKDFGVAVYFVIALNTNDSVNRELQREAERHEDIIQFKFVDSYWNLTLKTISILRWVHRECPQLKYALKIDDDVILNMNQLMDSLATFKSGITGRWDKSSLNRKSEHKQYIPVEYYPSNDLLEYVWGGAYVVTTDVISKLLDTIDSYTDYILDIEDYFVTGIIAERAEVKRYPNTKFVAQVKDNFCSVNDENLCRVCHSIAVVECESGQDLKTFSVTFTQHNCSSRPYCTFSSALGKSVNPIVILITIVLIVYYS